MEKAVECIKENRRFLVTMHVNMEGDALGAALALRRLLKKLGKEAMVINDDEVPQVYSFLPGAQEVRRTRRNFSSGFDCFAAVDCSDLKRCGRAGDLAGRVNQVLNIDHHVSNVNFGTANWVMPGVLPPVKWCICFIRG